MRRERRCERQKLLRRQRATPAIVGVRAGVRQPRIGGETSRYDRSDVERERCHRLDEPVRGAEVVGPLHHRKQHRHSYSATAAATR
jgi:hypothetical protein